MNATKKQYSQYFTSAKRVDTDKHFIKCKDEAPEELRDFIREVHFEYFEKCLPNDWIYQTILEAFENLEENNIDDLNIEPDCYYSELYEWLGNPFAHGFCNEGLLLLDGCNAPDIYQVIGQGQALAKEEIYRAVNEFLSDQEEENQE